MGQGRVKGYVASVKVSKVKSEAHQQGALTRQIGSEIQRIQAVVLIRDVQQSKPELSPPLGKAITAEEMELPEVIAGQVLRKPRLHIALTVLAVPSGLDLTEKSRAVIVNGEEVSLG